MGRRAAVWIAFVLVHAVVIWLGFADDRAASWDVGQLYRWWAWQTLNGQAFPGITEDWIYPALAHLPIVVTGLFWPLVDYTLVWGLLVTALDAAAFALLVGIQTGSVKGKPCLAERDLNSGDLDAVGL